MDEECTHLADADSDLVSSEDSLASGLVGRGWYGVPRNFSLNLVMIVANAMTSLRNM